MGNIPAILFIFIVNVVFFIRLFLPTSVFVTPDFGRSDALHSNLPEKLILQKSLKSLRVPLWENNIGQGYPVFAQGIMGFFYLPNLVIFGLLPFNFAIPTMYVFTFLTSSFSMFYLIKKLRFGNLAATISGISFALCASMILHVQHFNFIQSASLLPLLFLWLLNFLEKKNVTNAIICSLILSQIILAGFVQIFTYTAVIFFLFAAFLTYLQDKQGFKKVILSYICIVLFSIMLSAIQILPSYELTKSSTRNSGVAGQNLLEAFPLFPRNYLTYLNPFILGKAQDGSYNHTQWSKYGIFWESTSYIGLIPLIFYFVGLYFLLLKRANYVLLAVFTASIIAILLSLGKYSPLHIVFAFPPLNYFRVPARFILLVQFLTLIIAAYGIKSLQEKIPKINIPILQITLVIFTAANLFFYWANYNPIGETKKWLTPPELANSIDSSQKWRIFSFASKQWNNVFTTKGWQNQDENYYFFRNSLDQNLNLLYGISQFSHFETLPTRRYDLQNLLLRNSITQKGEKINITKRGQNILKQSNVRYLISPNKIESEGLSQVKSVSKDNFIFYLYELENPNSRTSLYYDYKSVKTTGQYANLIEEINPAQTVLLENIENLKLENGKGSISTIKIEEDYQSYKITTDKQGIFVVSNSPYPGWEATIDNKKTTIHPANINSQAIIVPQGEHKVEFEYKPKSFLAGLIISCASYIFALIWLVKERLKFLNRFINTFLLTHL
ncbi:MAG: hypothetical protein UU05_C0004G0005 [Candidatus Curtissbacteria bacterium GW2011_GWA1_40_47]|uniref:Membrane protein 6-pyruvoyl-tetrahydropterin synthase-related domain-containing protein n=1 Tax=Candidatus Curtissbacteria bacterium RIFOXYA1_FULL_41_14 TaxID=1797737 RepID=A0A1F5HGI5_9BACT|nr:MAG: hypothetical protein UT95_C0005G0012 [Candidatus Curtissbacteria bacterium GW2011_GWB1_40_28]KKR61116.1 MAG: hypothetical protein UT99_C0002G0045 [Candidatus Curtissbacteria bacterium GW2011_GWA2_40_31]KKR61997.1 MAG: hypothetical protein UU00_C0005G0053 [Microgenomates group bacterium GW2011_GWC1_40_35]KKR66157.1 MAG: hypothetical protein UU05_C0004G0005 [Candidatus Curtissbacteria bacterium GW2011_GWA1_40_47]KKR76225.1 MAG: hypothetical protein UU19_C0033G0004 [Candidatus Curtissbacte